MCKNNLGFKSKEKELTKDEMRQMGYIPQDLISYGFIPELVGRIFMYGELRELTSKDILKIMFQGKKSPYIEKTRFLANVLNVEQQISKKFLENVAEKLTDSKTYARDLESKIVAIFYPIIQIAFEHRNEYGICEIFEDGTYSVTYDDIVYYGDVSI